MSSYEADLDFGRLMARTENKGTAEVREWEINGNSTRYDYLLAAPSDEQLTKYWYSWAGISLFGGIFVAIILIGCLSSRNVRSRSFNLYLIYLMIADSVYSTLCGIVCLLHALNGSQIASLCNFQMMFVVWGVGSNMWLNAAITHQLYAMLRSSTNYKSYKVPTNKYVTMQALGIYLGMIVLGSFGLIEAQEFPHYVASTSGLACLPVEQDWRSSIFFWLFFFPLFGGIPCAYITYVTFVIWKHKLLPPTGKRRLLVIYFGRIVLVFMLCWVPYVILLFVLTTWMPTWVHFLGGTLSHLQGAASASLSLLKPDLLVAVKRFYCRWHAAERGVEDEPIEGRNSRGWLLDFKAASKRVSSTFRRSSASWSRSSIGKRSSKIPQSLPVLPGRSSFEGGSTENENGASTESPPGQIGTPLDGDEFVDHDETAADPSPEPAFASEIWPDENGVYTLSTTSTGSDVSSHNDVREDEARNMERGDFHGANKEAIVKINVRKSLKDFDLNDSEAESKASD